MDDSDELQEVSGRLAASGAQLLEQKNAACCYARSDKAWVTDPQGIAWETFHSHGEITVYGEDSREASDTACCETVRCGTEAGEGVEQSGDKSQACCG